jgi:tRNA A37 threonylcarbamoyladenosine modification protein TsaB
MFAEGVAAKLWGVTSLDAIALAGSVERGKSETPILVTADARRSEVYWALYSGLSESGAPLIVEGPAVAKPAALEEFLLGRAFDLTNCKVSAAELGKVFVAQTEDGTASQNVSALYLREADAVAPKDLREFGKRVSG